MCILSKFLRGLIAVLGLITVFSVQARDPAVPEAVLTFANRDIVTLRATALGSTPEVRARRIHERLRQLDDAELAKPLGKASVTVDGRKGIVFTIGDRNIFILYEADLDSEEKLSLDESAKLVETKLKEAISVSLETTYGDTLFKGFPARIVTTLDTAAIYRAAIIQAAKRHQKPS